MERNTTSVCVTLIDLHETYLLSILATSSKVNLSAYMHLATASKAGVANFDFKCYRHAIGEVIMPYFTTSLIVKVLQQACGKKNGDLIRKDVRERVHGSGISKNVPTALNAKV